MKFFVDAKTRRTGYEIGEWECFFPWSFHHKMTWRSSIIMKILSSFPQNILQHGFQPSLYCCQQFAGGSFYLVLHSFFLWYLLRIASFLLIENSIWYWLELIPLFLLLLYSMVTPRMIITIMTFTFSSLCLASSTGSWWLIMMPLLSFHSILSDPVVFNLWEAFSIFSSTDFYPFFSSSGLSRFSTGICFLPLIFCFLSIVMALIPLLRHFLSNLYGIKKRIPRKSCISRGPLFFHPHPNSFLSFKCCNLECLSLSLSVVLLPDLSSETWNLFSLHLILTPDTSKDQSQLPSSSKDQAMDTSDPGPSTSSWWSWRRGLSCCCSIL